MSERVVRWSQKLLDLSLRNRLLNVRDGKQVLPLFCRDIATLEDRIASSETVPIETGDPEDGFLVSNVTPDETKKRLKNLYRVARTDLEESGVNTLFIALGFLSWRPADNDPKFYRAPLILVPVKLVRRSLADIRLTALDEDTVVNATVLELLRSQFHLEVPNMDPPPADEKGVDVNAIIDAFAKAVAPCAGWTVTRDAALGQFSFGKFVMWKDMTTRMEALRQNRLVEHLVKGGGLFDDGVQVFPPEEIGQRLDPAQTFCPLSADSSQMTAVLYSALGKTFVLHGPPGTGKSQTITNLIAHNLALGRRVLFVSEKKAALDVVHRRLSSIGLKPFCLELHSNKSGKAEVLAQFAEALAVPTCSGPADWTSTAQNLAAERDQLDKYVKALHRVFPNGYTACDCFAHQIGQGASPTRNGDAQLLAIDTLQQSRDAYEQCDRLTAELENTWRGTTADAVAALSPLVGKDVAADWTPGFERQVAAVAEDLRATSSKGFFGRLLGAFRNRSLVPFGTAYKLTPEAAGRLVEATDALRGVLAWRKVKAQAVDLGMGGIAESLELGRLTPEVVSATFRNAYAQRMLDAVISVEPALAGFNGLNHDACVKRFRELDARVAELAKGEVFARLAARLPRRRAGDCPAASELGILRRECEKKARHKPVRQLLAEIPHLAADIKPCFLMSPLSVAQYLPPDANFDLVVFDEASQIPVWDAVGVIARGKQLVCVGDPKQMPPTNFFQKGEADTEEEDDETVADMESILDECLAAGVHSAYLNWHYRSRHESLIAFSNHHFYGDRLNTFPSASDSPRLGVRFEFVSGGVFERRASRTNRQEAEALVDYVFKTFSQPGYRRRSVGVVTFSQAQQNLIEDLIEARREKDHSCEACFGDDTEEPFFVKNLENVQGDERDVILFSVGYAPDADGKFAMNFGPLNRDGGERRLNVAVTRAKQQVVVFSSIHGSQIDLSRTSATGAALLREFLEFAEKGGVAVSPNSSAAESDPFAEEFPDTVAEMLREHGWKVARNLGSGALRIDLAVHRCQADGYLLAIECDGPGYAHQRTARDRDMLRASVLKGLGWHVTRLWSVDWSFDRQRAEGALLSLLDALETREEQLSGEKAPPPAPKPSAASALPPGVTALRNRPEREVRKTRSIDEIPAPELVAAMAEVKKDFGECEEDALFKETLKRFGLSVLTPKARSVLGAARRGLAVALVALAGFTLPAANPYVGYIYPSGIQVGTTNRVLVGGQALWGLRGGEVSGSGVKVLAAELVPGFPFPGTNEQRRFLNKWLDQIAAGDPTPPRIPVEDEHFSDWRSNRWWTVMNTLDAQQLELVERFLFVPRNPLQMTPSLVQNVLVTIAVAADAKPGPRDFRLWTPQGFSPPRPLLITKAPHLQEPYFVPPHRPQPEPKSVVKLPCNLDGQIHPGQTDRWSLPRLKSGQVLTFRVFAREFQSYIGDAVPGFFNPVLRIVDAKGREVAFADDYFHHPDPVLTFTVPAAGDYTLEIHDNLYRGRADFVYSIQVTEGWKFRPQMYDLSLTPLPSCAIPSNAVVKVFNGVVAKAGEVVSHRFRIDRAGDYGFDLVARRRGSPLDGRVTVFDAAGKRLAQFNDVTNTVHLGSVIQAECDPVGKLHLEPGDYVAKVQDEANKGGRAYCYSLRIHRPEPRFDIWVNASGMVAMPWRRQPVVFHVLRKDGFDQPITLEDNEFLTFKPNVIPAASNHMAVAMVARPHAPTTTATNVTIWATAKRGERQWRVPVTPSDSYNQAFAWDHLLPARGFTLRMLPAPPPKKPVKPAVKPTAKPAAKPAEKAVMKPSVIKPMVGGE